ncbi:GIY-YIG nuclease family protein [Nostoc sp. CCY 9925]|uniref:GIY-YIG nuclease family protein n=1 Tax=Nostoc sp. CCY 9925 TaxID=3103865 RepID=UPI0039C6D942
MQSEEIQFIQDKSISSKARRCCEFICSLLADGSTFTTGELAQKARLNGFGDAALQAAKAHLLTTQRLIRFQPKISSTALWMSQETYLSQGHPQDRLWEQKWQLESRYRYLPLVPKNSQGGFVYFVKRLGDGIYKIGLTACLRKRIQNIVSQCGSHVDVIFYLEFDSYEAANSLEDKLHEQYQYQRLIGEWFSFSDVDVEQLILDMKRRYNV